jgi:hypothetical protein
VTPVYKLSASSIKGRTNYGSMLAGNSTYVEPGDYYSIATTTVGSGGSSTITFNSIAGTYSHLQIRMIARTNRTGYSNDLLKITFNSDTGSNYANHYLYADGSGVGSGGNASQAAMQNWVVSTDAANTSVFGACEIDILDYANTNKYKTIRSLGGFNNNGDGYIVFNSGLWQSTSAITSISITMNSGTSFKQYSSFALYGIKGVA